jgi:hypothetical protein
VKYGEIVNQTWIIFLAIFGLNLSLMLRIAILDQILHVVLPQSLA